MTIDKNCQVKLFGTTQPSINAIRFALYQEKEGTYVWLPGFQLVNDVIEPRVREKEKEEKVLCSPKSWNSIDPIFWNVARFFSHFYLDSILSAWSELQQQ